MTSEFTLQRDGVQLGGLDFGGQGPAVLLLHGLAGHAGEWAETAGWLSERARVVALDARGHGRSARHPADVSPAAHAGDAALAVERLGLAPVVLAGQSLGGQTALLVAAGRPDLARGLVVADASPADGGDDLGWIDEAGHRLRRWPVPFDSYEAAVRYFDGASAWADGLEHRDGGWWPRFDVDVMVRTLRAFATRSHWSEWERIACPTLVVRAGNGVLTPADAREMLDRLAHARLAELPDAAHDLHLDRPAEWRRAVTDFLDSLA